MNDLFGSAKAGRAGAGSTIRPRTSRSWRGWSRCAAAPACISAAPTRTRCTTWPPRSSTTRWTRRSPAMPRRSTSPAGRQLAERPGQWPRHPRRSASQVQDAQRARGHPHHAALRRQIRRRRVCDVRRPARRRQFRGQRAERLLEVEVARDRVLWRQSYARGKPTTKLVNAGPVQNRRGTTIRFKPDPEIFGAAAVQPGTAVPPLPLQGLPVPRRADPLDLRPGAAQGPRRRPGGGAAALPRRPAGQPGRGHRRHADGGAGDLGRRGRPADARGWPVRRPGGMGGDLAGAGRRLPALLLQHGADAAGRHARGRVPRRLAEGDARLGRAAQQPPGRAGHRRGRDGQHGGQAVRLRARPAVPGPDQGEADQRRRHPAGGDGDAGPVRPLAGRQPGAGRQPADRR